MAIAALSGVMQGIHSKLTPQLSRRYGRPEGEGSSPSDCQKSNGMELVKTVAHRHSNIWVYDYLSKSALLFRKERLNQPHFGVLVSLTR